MRNNTFKLFGAAILLVLANCFQSCSVIHVYQTDPQNATVLRGNQAASPWKSCNADIFLWGATRKDVRISNCWSLDDKKPYGIEEIKIEKNFWRISATVLTLGIWEPVKISWRCSTPSN